MKKVLTLAQRLLGKTGYRLQKLHGAAHGDEFAELHRAVRLFTMTSVERQQALYDAVAYIIENDIEGDIVECGVWKGGSAMLVAMMLRARGVTDRTIYLYDTFAGMSEPTPKDVNMRGKGAQERWLSLKRETFNEWDYASLEEVRKNMASTEYPAEKLVFVEGKVEDTIPAVMPEKIALLRLDTDWYESTRQGMEHLFPRLVPGGILILDDYGHWKGARDAVDEYLAQHNIRIFLNRIDYSGRIAVKL
jgi:hypothetical protein